MLSDYYLYSMLGGGTSSLSSLFGSLTYPLTSSTDTTASLAASALSDKIDSETAKASAYDDLLTAVKAFQSTLEGFDTASEVASVSATSTDETVATASATASAGAGNYDLTVNQVAKAETVVSGSYADADTTVVGSGTITIQIGQYDSGGNTFTPDGSASVDVTITNGTLNDVADAINAADAGVTASVVNDGSGYTLALTSTDTGATNGFSITVSGDTDGNNTDSSGLSALAYDPTAAAGSGKNLTETQAAQDASYSVNGVDAVSESNSNIEISPGVTVSLVQAGSTTVSVSESADGLTSAAQDFVDGYNTLMSKIADLTGSGGALEGDTVASQLVSALQNELSTTFAASGSYDSLYQIGITPQSDGTLSLDSDTLATAFAADSSGATSLLNEAASTIGSLVDNYTTSGGLIDSTAGVYGDNLVNLQTALPALQQMGTQTQTYANAQYAAAMTQLYTYSLNESLLSSYSSGSTSLFA